MSMLFCATVLAAAALLLPGGRCASQSETTSLLSFVREERQATATSIAMCRQRCLTTFITQLLIVRRLQLTYSEYYLRRRIIFFSLINCQANCEAMNVNECETGDANCDLTRSTCQDTPTGFSCPCNQGFSGDGRMDGAGCQDIDECATNTDSCSTNAVCTNNDGSFTCACQTGFAGDGLTCTDVDECATNTDNCDATNAVCTNTVGSFMCSCQIGFQGDGVTACNNIDECANVADNNCDANANCTDTEGSFMCTCRMGFLGDGVTCCPNPIISIDTALSTQSVSEGTSTVMICIDVENELKSSITIQLETMDGTAMSQLGDYVETRNLFTLNTDGQCFSLDIILDDPNVEGSETFSIVLTTQAQNVALGSPTSLTITITDND